MHHGKLKKRDPARERFWRGTIRRQAQSGLSIRAFCQEHEIAEPSFFAWRRELARRDGDSAEPTRSLRPQARNCALPKADAKRRGDPIWAQLRLAPAELSVTGAAIEIVLSADVRVRVPAGADRQTLCDVLAALEARRC
jgi:transposase-like protein